MASEVYDVVIVGAGTAGLSLAYLLAKEDVNVAVLERKPRDKIGYKVCGDAIAAHHFRYSTLPKPPSEVVVHEVRGIRIFPYDIRYHVTVISDEGGYVVDRLEYGQHLLELVEKYGATVLDSFHVSTPIIKNNYVVGVKGIHRGKEYTIHGKIIVDASGYSAVLLSKLPNNTGIEKVIDKRDVIISYREIIELNGRFEDPGYLWIHFIDKYAPGGYVWIFPHSRDCTVVNVGNGVQAGLNYPNPKFLLSMYKEEYEPLKELFKSSKIIDSGIWNIPNRRPRGMLVWNGFLLIGDAAIQIDPTTAEGIGYGMYGAYAASKAILQSLEDRDYSIKSLWSYCHSYMTSRYGVNQAKFDVFRYLLQSVSEDAHLFAIKHKIIRDEELSSAKDRDIRISMISKAIRALKGLLHGKIEVIKALNYVLKMMRAVGGLYRKYPIDPREYLKWKAIEESLFNEIKERFPPYIPHYYR